MGNQHLPAKRSNWCASSASRASASSTSRTCPPMPSSAARRCDQGTLDLRAGRTQQMKEERGLDPFEGRSWTGVHRQALVTMMAYAFPIPACRRGQAGKEWVFPSSQPRMTAIR